LAFILDPHPETPGIAQRRGRLEGWQLVRPSFEGRKRYVPTASTAPTPLAAPGLPFSLVFRSETGKEDVIVRIASAYERASKRRVPPPAFCPLSGRG
jgi:hypothetical protein